MKKSICYLFLILFMALSISARSQSRIAVYDKTLTLLDNQHQACLDAGDNMLNCSERYYVQMDSMLNVVYKALVNSFPDKKLVFREEQRTWLKKRDKKFIDIEQEKVDEISSYDNQVLSLNKKSSFVEKRVRALMNKLSDR